MNAFEIHNTIIAGKSKMDNQAGFDLIGVAGNSELFINGIIDNAVQLCAWPTVRSLWGKIVYKAKEIISRSDDRKFL